jgi:hypothetical protein
MSSLADFGKHCHPLLECRPRLPDLNSRCFAPSCHHRLTSYLKPLHNRAKQVCWRNHPTIPFLHCEVPGAGAPFVLCQLTLGSNRGSDLQKNKWLHRFSCNTSKMIEFHVRRVLPEACDGSGAPISVPGIVNPRRHRAHHDNGITRQRGGVRLRATAPVSLCRNRHHVTIRIGDCRVYDSTCH